VLFKPVADFPLENLILAETNQSRTSPLREAGGTLCDILPRLPDSISQRRKIEEMEEINKGKTVL